MEAWQLTVGEDKLARLVFDLPGEKINKLSLPILNELEAILDQLSARKDLDALVLTSGKDDIFIAGADIKSFEEIFKDGAKTEEMMRTGHRVFNKLSQLPFPTIALIDGACLGGGLELALACTYRIATTNPKTSIGLPEVNLGIIPGWGGTQRLPRLIGLQDGLQMVLTGKPVKAEKAYRLHLVDALVAKEFKEEKSTEFVEYWLTGPGKEAVNLARKQQGFITWLLGSNALGRNFIFQQAKNKIMDKTQGHYPAPLLALQVIQDSFGKPLNEGLEIEIKGILSLLASQQGTSIARNLIRLFFTTEALKKDSGGELPKPKNINSTGVLGGGVMGSGIAYVLSNSDIPVRMKEIDLNALGKGFGAIKSQYDANVREKRMKPYEASLKFQRVSGTVDPSGFQATDVVIEAATENFEVKQKLFSEMEKVMRPDALLATNTSSYSVKALSETLRHKERFIGMHFFNPVSRMALVEIVPGPSTNKVTVATAVALCKKLGKTPIVVGDCPGFLVNRLFAPGANESMRLLEEGVAFDRLEKLLLQFGFPMGPFTLADEIGIDILAKVNRVFESAYGPRMKGAAILEKMLEKRLLGKKSGEGFFLYDKGKKRIRNPEISLLLDPVTNPPDLSDQQLQDRIILPMINEAARCLEEQVIARPDYLDMALILGFGFPPFRGGLLTYADSLGIDYVVNHLKQFESLWGERFKPANKLLEMQRDKKTFH